MTSRSNAETLVTVYGGSGFLGRHVVRALAKRDYRIRVAVRRPDLAFHLQPLGRVGQIHAVQANLRYAAIGGRGGARRPCAGQSGRHAVRARAAALRRRPRRTAPSRWRWRRAPMARAWCTCRRSAPTSTRPRAYARSKAEAERLVLAAQPQARHHAALDHVRAGGRFLQPLRRAGAHLAGAAADRRRHTPASSRSSSATSPRPSRGPSTATPRAARSTSWAGRRCGRSSS